MPRTWAAHDRRRRENAQSIFPGIPNRQKLNKREIVMTEKIGFVGVGRMGANMARRLKDVGYPVTAVYDVRAEAAQALAPEVGARAVTRLAEVTEAADVIITVVTDDKAMQRIYGPSKKGDSLLANAAGKLFINCATISPKI